MVWSCRRDDRRLKKEINESDLDGNAVRGGPRGTFLGSIDLILERSVLEYLKPGSIHEGFFESR
jgi:hypothetical protein